MCHYFFSAIYVIYVANEGSSVCYKNVTKKYCSGFIDKHLLCDLYKTGKKDFILHYIYIYIYIYIHIYTSCCFTIYISGFYKTPKWVNVGQFTNSTLSKLCAVFFIRVNPFLIMPVTILHYPVRHSSEVQAAKLGMAALQMIYT